MMWLRRTILALPIVLAVFFAAAFISVRFSAPQKLNEFVSGSIGEPETLNPILSTTMSAAEVEARIFSGLIRYDENLEIVGDLAVSWEIGQTSRWFFPSEAEAREALQRVAARRERWKTISLKDAACESRALRLSFASASTSYREELANWLGDLKPLPVTFLDIQLKTEEKFPDGVPVRADELIKRVRAGLSAAPGLAERVIYTWTGGAASYVEIPLFGAPGEMVSLVNALLNAEGEKDKPERSAAGEKKKGLLGSCKAEDPLPSLDEPEITFHLRKGVRWHDGAPFTSADALFTYESLMSEEVASPQRSDYELIRQVTAPDDYTLRVLYKKPYSPALLSWSVNILPRHILAGKSTRWWAENYNPHPIGTGPFILDAWKTNDFIRMRKNKDYWEGAPHLDDIVVRSIPDTLSLRLCFETDEIDVLGVEPFALGAMQQNPNYQIFSRIVPAYTYVGWNLKRPLFQDRRVRQALAHAVNVPEIIQYILYGQGVQSNGAFPPDMWYSNPDVKPFVYDPARAKALLAEAGWTQKDSDGWLVKDGTRFEFILITNQANEIRKDVATLVQEDLKRLGILVKVEIYEWTVFIEKKINTQDFDACVLGWALGYNYDQYQLWHSSQSKPGRLNFCSYSNPQVDKLLVLARSEFDRDRVRQYCREIQRLIYEDQPYMFLYVPKGVTALHKGVFQVLRPDGRGGWADEPIRATKAGIGIYDTWWRRTAFMPTQPRLPAGGQVKHSP